MEKKRKLPARASARVESANKRRNVTPRERSETPAPPPPPPPVIKEPTPPPPLPKSIQPGKPLPTVEDAQPEDLSAKEYQSISESGVLSEALSRSRHKWISDGLFEKYWTKPFKRKGVLNEDPKNPPKDSMAKVGTVTITIEPHIVEATMFIVKDSKPRLPATFQQNTPKTSLPQTQPPVRPILQYGPPNGSMPPPSAPKASTPTPNTPTVAPTPTAAPSPSPIPPQQLPQPSQPPPTASLEAPKLQAPQLQAPQMATNVAPTPSPSPGFPPRPAVPALAAPQPAPQPVPQLARPLSNPPSEHHPSSTSLARPPASAPPPANTISTTRPLVSAAPSQPPAVTRPPAPAGQPPAPAVKPPPNDPVIALLAQKASGDAALRDLMKRVAVGQAKEGELAHFQKIIDQLSAEYRRSGGQQGPSADRLLVDGKTVKYFADEVRTILNIVLASNPEQKSGDLRPPPRSDPLVVLLVKTALEDQRTKDMITRIAEGRPGFTDSTDLKEILDRLHRDAKTVPQGLPTPSPAKQQPPNGGPNGHTKPPQSLQAPQVPQTPQQPNQQALRSKGPPPTPKHDVSAVVFDFGNGDRYLFPKFSILEYLPTNSGQEVVASFLIVRKGSISEYGGDPKLDYYQPVTIRVATPNGRHLENLARVVAPQDEVRRYMDDVMDNMTRAEYVLLAMRLPRVSRDGDKEDGVLEEPKTNSLTPQVDSEVEQNSDAKPSVLWTTSATNSSKRLDSIKRHNPERESEIKYQRLIQSVAAKDA
ncbi:hypothetical protein PT974_05910 [Cladobotryum mycophilum]|uniref:SWR1-complex protein 3 domain-containing protein n=1 Tax=Cladobotryum mycophilum TaxID=491253 RepID=A0ABR0SK21_9HYPO